MPKYIYKCNDCGDMFKKYHSVSLMLTDCDSCGTVQSLQRLPSSFSLSEQKSHVKKVGDEVKKAISDFKQDLEQQKQEMVNTDWSEDD